MTNNNSVKKSTLICLSMDLEEQGLNLLKSSDFDRNEAKAAFKAGYSIIAARLMKAACTKATQAYECLALSDDYREEAAKL